MDSAPPLLAATPLRRPLRSMLPPPLTSSTAPRSSSSDCAVREMLPPAVLEAAPVPLAASRADGSGVPTNEPSALAVLIQAPAVDTVAPRRTMMRVCASPISAASSGAADAAGAVIWPAGRCRRPAISMSGARSVKAAPTGASTRTPAGTVMGALAFSSTLAKPLSARPWSVTRAGPKTAAADRLKPLLCACVMADAALKAAPSVSRACCTKVMAPTSKGC